MTIKIAKDLNCKIYSFLASNDNDINFDAFIIDNIPQEYDRYAGYEEKDKLKEIVQGYSGEDISKLLISKEKEDQIIEQTFEVINQCNKILPFSETLQIFFFPTKSEFIMEKMGGISGLATFKNTFLVFVHPDSDLHLLPETISHEYNHAIILNNIKWLTIGEGIVTEGLAENFRERVIGGEITPWANSLTEEEAKKWYVKIKKLLSVEDNELYQDIFTNSKSDYPLWTGYAVGYQLIKSYLKQNPDLSWTQLMSQNTDIILQKVEF